MNRREFIALIGGAAAWPLAARAQQRERIWRIGFLRAAPPPEHEQLVGGAAVAWPLMASAQQAERVRRIGVLMGFGESAGVKDTLALAGSLRRSPGAGKKSDSGT